MEPVPPALEMQILNHWTTREIPKNHSVCHQFIEAMGAVILNICVVVLLISVSLLTESYIVLYNFPDGKLGCLWLL